ncbi:hypothetical protein [Serratia proteamaculans]|uniref:hypothetical protein n=1 Tax=Serratia proteamaculans TaxID=28151 RepID=UPI0010E935A2|nr:hypothetical protein [Serratia proteamaculans]RYM49136.1 hypothetical protein BSQ97_19650 [Serratia proteamaculans]
MSGKPIKKKPEQVGQTAPAEVNAPEAPVIAPTVTGHYQPVAQPSAPPQSAAAASELTGVDITLTVKGDVTGTQLDAEQLENVRNNILGLAGDEEPTSMVVLLVQAVSPNGFWRAGQFWPHAGVHVFVDAELEVDILAPYISVAIAERLKAEPHLRVTVLDAITTEDPEA